MVSGPWQIELVRIGSIVPSVLRELREDLAGILSQPVWISDLRVDPSPFLDTGRRQYGAHLILEYLLDPPPEDMVRRIGITDLDLFLPVFTHVFGAAQLGGVVGIASTYRLRSGNDSTGEDPARIHDRLVKETLHEIGHTLSLVHCHVPWCAMGASRLPEHVDLKDRAFCDPCADVIGVPRNGFRTSIE